MKNLMLLLLLLLLLLAVVLLSGCSNCKIENKHVEVSQYLCANNGGWQHSYITSPFKNMKVQCFDGSLYNVEYQCNLGYFYIEGNTDKNINKKVNSIMGGTEVE